MKIELIWVMWLMCSMAGSSFSQQTPKTYDASYLDQKICIDGKEESVWDQAEWSELFVDIEGTVHNIPDYKTKVKMMWNEEGLYILSWMEEPHLWATLDHRDAIIYRENDFEVFVKPDPNTDHYFEYEINAKNTLMDLLMTKPYNKGGKALLTWNSAKVQHAVRCEGSLNNSNDVDQGWWMEMMIPYQDLVHWGADIQPKEGRHWLINFSRVDWDLFIENGMYVKKKGPNGRNLPENNWVWSPQYQINMHIPEHWGKVIFCRD